MSWTLKLDFLGLTGLVPLEDGRWLVAFPNLRRGSIPGELPHDVVSHQALVAVSPDHVHPTSTVTPPRLTAWSESEGRRNIYELNRHHLRLSGAGDAVTEIRDGGDNDLSWVPSLKEMHPKAGSFDGSLLTDWFGELVAPSSKLAATVLLDRGRLGSRRRLREDGGVSLYEFRHSKDHEPVLEEARPMADGFRLSLDVEDDTAALVFGNSDGDENELVLYPNGQAEVTVDLHNEELEDVLGFDTDPIAPNLGDIDFAVFYSLCADWPELKSGELPIPFRRSTGGGGKNRPCRSPKFAEVKIP